jgi:hypothetical protein
MFIIPCGQQNQAPHWSPMLNCQTFTHSAIECLGYKFAWDVTFVSDCVPTTVNIYMNISLLTAQTEEKTNQRSVKWKLS